MKLFGKQSFELGFQLAHLERETHDLVVLGHRAFGKLGAEVAGKLTVVKLADDDLLVFLEDVAGVLRQRANIVEVGVSHLLALMIAELFLLCFNMNGS